MSGPQTVALNNGFKSEVKHEVSSDSYSGAMMFRVQVRGTTVGPYPGFVAAVARLTLEAQLGGGTTTSVDGEGGSGFGAERAFGGAIVSALNRLLIDEKFLAYMNR